MPLESLYLDNFRLFKNTKLEFKENHTIIFGKNGSGKTSILEAINLLHTNKSLRSKDLSDCTREGQNAFILGVSGSLRHQEFIRSLKKETGKRVENKLKAEALKKEDLELPVVILNKQLKLIDGDPEIRRDFFYRLMFHVKHEAKRHFSEYTKILSQRNKSLKQKVDKRQLDIWTNQLVESGQKLSEVQKETFDLFKKSVAKEVVPKRSLDFYKGLNLKFQRGWPSSKKFSEALHENYEKDRALGYTQLGPHKFDFNFYLHNKKSKDVLSRGQQKLLILLTFLSINDFFDSLNCPGSILLIDDLTSELDHENLKLFLQEVPKQKNQIIMTDIDASNSLKKDKIADTFEKIII